MQRKIEDIKTPAEYIDYIQAKNIHLAATDQVIMIENRKHYLFTRRLVNGMYKTYTQPVDGDKPQANHYLD